MTEYILLGISVLLLLSVIASKVSARLGVPALLIFLGIGMLAGSDGLGGIHFDDPGLAQSIGVIALAFILFSGGLDTSWKTVRPVLWKGFSLSTLGVLLSTLLVGVFAKFLLKFSWTEGLLLGAIVSATDAAAVFTILRSKNIGLKTHLRPLLELESGSNDPMAVFLTIGFITLLAYPNTSIANLLSMFLHQMIVGAVLGYGLAKMVLFLINQLKLEYEGLYPVLSLTLVLLVYSLTASLGGNGFLAVYVAGLMMGNTDFIHKKSLLRFHDGLAWLMQIAMFLALGLLVFPTQLMPIAGAGFIISTFLIVVARPASVLISLLFSKMNVREKAFVSWVGLRGAVPIILATFPLVAKIPRADFFFNLVFFIVLTSSLLQGGTVPLMARCLKVTAPLEKKRRYPIEFEQLEGAATNLVEYIIPYHSNIVGKKIVELGLPEDSLITLICRNEEFIVPSGATPLDGGDVVLTLVNDRNASEVNRIFSEPKNAQH
ncbi:MAG: potassium/proton antiporter [Deltaproteobacteria bacterium]|nr:potassium/proton antiporter [Deltaproteobacteria bacterium]